MDARANFLQQFRDFVQSPSLDKAKSLRSALNKNALHTIQSTGQTEYFLAPILTIITEVDARNKNEIVPNLIAIATVLIEKCRIKSMEMFETVLAIMIRNIAEAPNFLQLQPNLSEERKLNVIQCLDATFRQTNSDVIEQFFSKEKMNRIAQCLIIATTLARTESYRALRLAAVKCIMSIFWVNDEADHDDIVLRAHIADATFLLIPKVLSTLTDIASGDMKQGESLIQLSVKAIGRILHLIFHEYEQIDNTKLVQETRILIESSINSTDKTTVDFNVLNLPSIKSVDNAVDAAKNKPRSPEWLKAASVKLLPLIEKLSKLVGSDSNDIKSELNALAITLLSLCQRNMSGCVSKLLEISMSLHDLNDVHQKFIYNDTLIDSSEEMFEALLIRLPRIICTGYAHEQIAGFQVMCGLTKLLCETDRMKIILANDSILNTLVSVLMNAVESYRSDNLLDINDIIYDINDRTQYKNTDTFPWKDFKNLRDIKVAAIIRTICDIMSNCSPVNVIVLEKLYKLLQSNTIDSNEAIIIIQFFVEAKMNPNDLSNESMHSDIMAEILQDFRWSLATECDTHSTSDREQKRHGWYESKVDGLYESALTVSYVDSNPMDALDHFDRITIKDVKSNIQHMCLIIELVSLYAKRMEQRFDRYLLKSLHRLLEKSASMYYIIRMSAVTALNNVKCAYRLDNIAALINVNIDYITHAISMALKKSDQIDVALRILSVVLRYSSLDAIAHLEHIVATIIGEISKIDQSQNIHAFIQASAYVLTTIRDHSKVETDEEQPKSVIDESSESKSYLETWLNILHTKDDIDEDIYDDVAENATDEADIEQEIAAETPDDDEETIPPLVGLTKNMMTQIIAFFASKEQKIKLAALKCLSIGLDIIKNYENELLPMVHQIWAPFVGQCIEDKSPVVLRYCVRLYVKLAKYAKDFINSRSSSEALPHIVAYLQMLSKKPANEKQMFLYEHSQEYKLLHEFMYAIPDILIYINVRERDFDQMLNAVIWLLDVSQPSALQSACVDLMKKFSEYDVCAVFVKLLEYRTNPRYSSNCDKIFPANIA